MELKEALEEKVYDLRLRDRLVAEGKLKKEELEKFLKNLKDETDNYVTLGSASKKHLKS